MGEGPQLRCGPECTGKQDIAALMLVLTPLPQLLNMNPSQAYGSVATEPVSQPALPQNMTISRWKLLVDVLVDSEGKGFVFSLKLQLWVSDGRVALRHIVY